MKLLFSIFLCSLLVLKAQAQPLNPSQQFLSYEKIPTWSAIASGWQQEQLTIHLYDYSKYRGHAEYVSREVEKGITFKQFKEKVHDPATRSYLPFFLFDLRKEPIQVDGKTIHWVIRVEDYRYLDGEEDMYRTAVRLFNDVQKLVNEANGAPLKGAMILAKSQTAQPNYSISGRLKTADIPYLSLSELLSSTGGSKVKVLNEGLAYGYLRLITAEQEATFAYDFKDIPVFEKLPKRVPPVSGIITLEPQTPLSHVNLLAKNRGTINLYTTDLALIPGATPLLGQLVRIECKQGKITIGPARLKEAEKFWENKKSLRVEVPQPDLAVKTIVSLNDSLPSVAQVGAKASNYALIRQQYPAYVRPGFAISFRSYFYLVKACGAQAMIKELIATKANLSREQVNARLAAIQSRIEAATVPEELVHEINQVIAKQYPTTRIRLRSSTNCEDLPEFNGAGLYLSKGHNAWDNEAKLRKKIKQVYASLWTPLAFSEREFYHIDHLKVGMAILINEAFSNELANGVVLVIPAPNRQDLIVNAQHGENQVTNPENGQIPESLLFSPATSDQYTVESKSNIQPVFLAEGMEPMLLELKRLSLSVNELINAKVEDRGDRQFGVDIEFKVLEVAGKPKLFLKQARLLGTTLPDH